MGGKEEKISKGQAVFIGTRPRQIMEMATLEGICPDKRDKQRIRNISGIMFRDEAVSLGRILIESSEMSQETVMGIIKSGLANLIILSAPVVEGILRDVN